MTSDLINITLEWLHQHANYSWLFTLLIASAESIAIIGTIIPGSITMTGIGALAGAGIIPLWSTLFWAFLGAVIGDGVSYFIGHHFKDKLKQTYLFNSQSALMQQGEKFFKHYGGLSVIIGRFVGPIRALIPLIAGMMGMKPGNFIIANILSAAGWAPAYMLPGIMLGAASLELPPDIATKIILITISWVIAIWLLIYLLKKIAILSHRYLLKFCTSHYHDLTSTPAQLALIVYFIISCLSFIALTLYVYTCTSSHIALNQSSYQFFTSISNTAGKSLEFYITTLGQGYIISTSAIAIILYLLCSKQIRLALHGLALLVISMAATSIIKNLTLSVRPSTIFKSYSYPSGHTTIATIFYGGILLAISKQLQPKTRKLALIMTILVIIAVATSRLYLGVHWFTDILGGLLLGIASLILVTISYNRKPQAIHNIRNFLGVILLSFAVGYGHYVYSNNTELHRYLRQTALPIKVTTLNAWYHQDNKFLDSWHLNVLGFASQAINIEWLGKLDRIRASLLANGWEQPPTRAWTDILFRLSGIKSAEHLPLIDPSYLDQDAALILLKHTTTKNLVVLRLWAANIKLQDSTDTLWVGAIAIVPRTYSWLSKHYQTTIEPSASLLFTTKVPALTIKYINIPLPVADKLITSQANIMIIK